MDGIGHLGGGGCGLVGCRWDVTTTDDQSAQLAPLAVIVVKPHFRWWRFSRHRAGISNGLDQSQKQQHPVSPPPSHRKPMVAVSPTNNALTVPLNTSLRFTPGPPTASSPVPPKRKSQANDKRA
ncbi:hypothetical protein K443DRAFT_10548 [Laccaria amethystina LaAM-08-1]|uniref:Uncharacterized protein n=1 Tax=Laccaria amethystina LaAM-08-1 TaxID=1095629 RepID=A0A0C9XFV6_9AGAR|nr:hypothetical protein K443DRAFT_10548 [Laccaria amethystina LaAM-08-1]